MAEPERPSSQLDIASLIAVFIFGVVVGGLILRERSNLPKIKFFDAEEETIEWRDEVVATNLIIPWDLAEEPGGRILITERPGKLKAMNPDKSIITLAEIPVATVSESGLTGIALHPDYEKNHYLYLYYTYRASGNLLNKIVRYTLIDNKLKEDKVIIDKLAGGQIHNGGRLRFGPDKKLYIETGDAARPASAQDRQSLNGKILRVNDDGSIPDDNPFSDSPVYSLGHRNPQGLDWHPLTEELYADEHGETAHDELNLIKAGQNYGWPESRGDTVRAGSNHQSPIFESGSDTWAPSGLAFYGPGIWPLRNTAFMAGLRSQQVLKMEIVDSRVKSSQSLLKGKYGRLRAVLKVSDGSLLISTSNRDGRNTPVSDDDRLIRLTPIRESR